MSNSNVHAAFKEILDSINKPSVSEQLVDLTDVALKEARNLIKKNQILLDGYNEILSLLLDTGGVTKEQIVGILQETIKKHNEK
jgi:hypothetical protein